MQHKHHANINCTTGVNMIFQQSYKLWIGILLCSISLNAQAVELSKSMDKPTGLEIMQAVDSREDGDDLQQHITQTLVDRNGNQRVRNMISFRKDYGKDSKSIVFFAKPANIRDTALLTFDYDDPKADDDQWLYLPALKKVRRISSSDRGDYFMGTDFTFEDMKQTPELQDYHWQLLGSETVDGFDCWKVEGLPASTDVARELGYSRLVQWIRKDNDFSIKAYYWDQAGRELKHLTTDKLEQIKGIWSPVSIEMVNIQSKHKTRLEFSQKTYNSHLKDRMFSQRTLKRGYRK